jgi:hypothetical protein
VLLVIKENSALPHVIQEPGERNVTIRAVNARLRVTRKVDNVKVVVRQVGEPVNVIHVPQDFVGWNATKPVGFVMKAKYVSVRTVAAYQLSFPVL